MTERLFQFIWQFQYFNKTELTTVSGESVSVIDRGQFNSNQGPDFLQAIIKIGTTTWVGNVELHLKTSDWKKHGHDSDENYSNVIVHVVWENDSDHPSSIPTLELKDRVSKILLQRYQELMYASSFIPCENNIKNVQPITLLNWKERLLAERLLRKSGSINEYLVQSNYHWEEVFWWLLARNFGMKVNADVFEEMARSTPLNLISKHKNQIHQLESLLLGQCGLLEENFNEDYPLMLQKEYQFFKNKYKLKTCSGAVYFLRMRPGNFPTIRLAQLAMLVHSSLHLFSRVKESVTIKEARSCFDITANDYWHYHYRFDESSGFKKKKLGADMVDNIMINTIAPLLFAYGNYHDENKYKDKAIQWLIETSSENNAITQGFVRINVENKNAFDSQALIELKSQYCDKKRCLDCGIGNFLLKD